MDWLIYGGIGFVLGGFFWVPVTTWLKTRWARWQDDDKDTW